MKTFNVIDKDSDFVGTVGAETEEAAITFVENLKGRRLYAELVEEEDES